MLLRHGNCSKRYNKPGVFNQNLVIDLPSILQDSARYVSMGSVGAEAISGLFIPGSLTQSGGTRNTANAQMNQWLRERMKN